MRRWSHLLAAGVVLLAARTGSAQTTVPIPVDTSKAILTIPVKMTFTDAQGVLWELTGTLTAQPKAQQQTEAPGDLARPLPGPQIMGFADHEGTRIGGDRDGKPVGFGVIGEPAAILGRSFGPLPGQVVWGAGLRCEVLSWEDAVIRFVVPPGTDAVIGGNVLRNTVGVRTAAGQWVTSLGFARRTAVE